MLTIKREENYKDALEEMGYVTAGGIEVMTVREGGRLLGIGVMRLFDTFASVDAVLIKEEYNSFELEYGLGKSMLNFIDLKGLRFAVSDNKSLEKLLSALRFRPICEFEDLKIAGEWKYCLNLDGYFTSNC